MKLTSTIEQKKRECWEEIAAEVAVETENLLCKAIAYSVFDRAFALGKQTETISQEEIEDAADSYADKNSKTENDWSDLYKGYCQGMKDALGKPEKDAKKRPALTDKEVYALESAISELESLMDGTLDEDYHKEQKTVINALKRIIKKYEKK